MTLKANKESAFTLVELMIVIAIVGIMMVVGTPSLRTFNTNSDADRALRSLLHDISFARNSSRDLRKDVQMIPINGSWQNGWLISVVNGDPLRLHEAVPTGVVITSAQYSTLAGQVLTFNNLGRVTPVGSFKIETAGCSGDRLRDINLTVMGQTLVTHSPC